MSKFTLGRIYLTRGVNDTIADKSSFAKFVTSSIKRHASGEWGNVCHEDRSANEQALVEGSRLFSVYEEAEQPKIWIITESDRSVTTILFPDEY